ncbi:hypothetical protein MK489_10300, partial [Myxococcota bacterium]|nr:hypothetical protein [Myxococcota bacterium]
MHSRNLRQRGPWRRLWRRIRPRISQPAVSLACRLAPPIYTAYLRFVFFTSHIDDAAFRTQIERAGRGQTAIHLFWHEGLLALAYAYQRLGLRTWALVGLGDAGDVLTG